MAGINIHYILPGVVYFVTRKTLGSKMWWVNNPKLHEEMFDFLAKYAEIYDVEVLSFKILGNHYHLVCKFRHFNSIDFFRDFHSKLQSLTKEHVVKFPGGRLLDHRRRNALELPNREDILDKVLYCWLNPVSSGIVENPEDYNGLCVHSDAFKGTTLKREIVNWTEYYKKIRNGAKVDVSEVTETYELTFARIPGMEDLSAEEYEQKMKKLFEERRQLEIKKRKEAGKGFLGKYKQRSIKPGAVPKNIKRRSPGEPAPICLTLCDETRAQKREEFLQVVDAYKKASAAYRNGDFTVEFPIGTCRPPVPVVQRV